MVVENTMDSKEGAGDLLFKLHYPSFLPYSSWQEGKHNCRYNDAAAQYQLVGDTC